MQCSQTVKNIFAMQSSSKLVGFNFLHGQGHDYSIYGSKPFVARFALVACYSILILPANKFN